MEVLLLVVSFAVILAGALLFTNAVEWIGHKLGLGEGAVGSLLAAVGTALPETLIAIVALVGATKSEDVAIGAIVGAPFLLATLAMGLVGLTAYLYRGRRKQGIELTAHVPTLDRDLAFFMVFFALGAGARLRRARGGQGPGRDRLLRLLLPLRVLDPARRGGEAGRGDAQPADHRAAAAAVARTRRWRCRPAAPDRPGGDGRRRPPVRRGADPRRRGPRRRGDRALADPGSARHRAAREGEQLLLGARGQGLPRARQHHGRDGLPVHDPGRDRADLHGVGAERQRRDLGGPRPGRRRCSPTGPCACATASSCCRCCCGSPCTRASSSSSPSDMRA